MDASGTVRILYMEDDLGLARLVQKRMKQSGYIVDIAPDGKTGLEMHLAGRYDVIAVDHKMPGYSGLEVIKILASRGPLPPIIMITGQGNEMIAVEAIKMGAGEYLVKDVEIRFLEALPGIIERLLERQRLIEDKMEAEKALRESEKRYRMLVEDFPAMICRFNLDGVLTFVNSAFIQCFGEKRRNLIGESVFRFIPENDREKVKKRLESLTRESPIATRELSPASHDGKIVRQEWIDHAIFNGNDRLIEFQSVGWDVSSEERAREEHARLERRMRTRKMGAIGTFAGGVAHNFNNLIHAVTGNLELALEDLPGGSEAHESLMDAMRAARQAADMTGLMLTFLGQAAVKREPTDLADACRESLPGLRSDLPAGVTITADFPVSGPVVDADAAHLRQVLAHLTTNAWEAAESERGGIHLTVGTVSSAEIPEAHRFPPDWRPRGDDHALLEVADQGSGIKQEDMDSIFDPFFTDKFTGRGLGLPVVLGIIKALDGGVTVESGLNRGSVFRVFLPLASEEAPRPRRTVSKTPRIDGGGLVLLVEDDAAVRKVGKTMLERLGFDVITAEDGAKAVKTFREEHADVRLVLSDLSMPRMNGWETLTELRKIRPDIPVILASGYDETQVMEDARDERPQAFLHKPYHWAALKAVLGRALEGEEGGETD